MGCGRAQFGGVGGNSHALAHAKESNHGVAVKLGSITPEGTADVPVNDVIAVLAGEGEDAKAAGAAPQPAKSEAKAEAKS